MALTNTSKPTPSITNATKVNIGETWATITTTWATETRTWGETASFINNSTKAFGGLLWAASTLPWQLPTPWLDTGGISNLPKP